TTYFCDKDTSCSNGACCGVTDDQGICGYGSEFCGDTCVSNCNATAACGKDAATPGTTCPLNNGGSVEPPLTFAIPVQAARATMDHQLLPHALQMMCTNESLATTKGGPPKRYCRLGPNSSLLFLRNFFTSPLYCLSPLEDGPLTTVTQLHTGLKWYLPYRAGTRLLCKS
ncbi:hypothetical protein N7495_000029, partial [Penicillium taxi]|uniref:uncharacterized protein n=1 Tax=Penicillium taxi TaxID=168475 RepID=UPI0025459A2D